MKKNALLLAAINCFAYDDIVSALKDTSVSGYGKSMYIYDDRKGVKLDQHTFGIGGKIALESGDFQGMKAKVAYYRTDDLGARSNNPKETDAYMFDVDKRPYSILGEAYVEYKNGNNSIKAGRQEIDTPIISTYDYRIIPNLFEAYTLTNKSIPDTTLTISYVTKMSGLDGLVSFKDFKSMSQQTYTSLMLDTNSNIDTSSDTIDVSKISSQQGVLMTGFIVDSNPRAQVWNYYCKDVLDEFYADIAFEHKIDNKLIVTLEAQGYAVRDVGKFKSFLSSIGLNDSYELYGAKISTQNKNLGTTISVAYDKFTGGSKTVTAFGNWGGYPEFVGMPYMFAENNAASAIANSQMARIAMKYDLSSVGASGHNITIGYSYFDIDEKILRDSDISLVNILYKAKITKKLQAKMLYELRNSKNYRYDNDTLTLSLTYEL